MFSFVYTPDRRGGSGIINTRGRRIFESLGEGGRLGHRFQRHSFEGPGTHLRQSLVLWVDQKACRLKRQHAQKWLSVLGTEQNFGKSKLAQKPKLGGAKFKVYEFAI